MLFIKWHMVYSINRTFFLSPMCYFGKTPLSSSEVLKVTGFRTHYPKIQNLGRLHIWFLKELEKWQVQESLSDLLLKQVTRPSCERCPHSSLEWRSILLSKDKEVPGRILANKSCRIFSSLLTFVQNLCPIIFFQDILLFIKPHIKMLRCNYFFTSSFPYKGSCVT